MIKWPWRSSQWPQFSIPTDRIPRCILCANLVIPAQICLKLLCRQTKFPKILESKWSKWTWRSRSMTPIFNTSQEYTTVHIWCKFGDSIPNLWWVIIWTNQTDRHRQWQWPFGLKDQAVKNSICIYLHVLTPFNMLNWHLHDILNIT